MRTRTSARLGICSAASLLAIVAAACSGGDTRPCNDCPDVAGSWMLKFEQGTAPSDVCVQQGRELADGPLALTQVGSSLTGTWQGTELRGTLYDTFDLSLNGTGAAGDGGTETVSVNGRFVPAQPALDAGARLQGSLTSSSTVDGATCTLSRGYTAARQ